MRDILHRTQPLRAISPVSVSDTTAQVSQIIDLQGCDGCYFAISVGAIASGTATFGILVQEGDQANLSDAATVADQDLTTATRGTAAIVAAAFTFANPNTTQRLGYIGNKRYIRLTITPASNAAAALLSAIAIRGQLRFQPS